MKSTERRELERHVPTDLGLRGAFLVSVNLAPFKTEFRLKVFGRYYSVAASVAPAKSGKPNNFRGWDSSEGLLFYSGQTRGKSRKFHAAAVSSVGDALPAASGW